LIVILAGALCASNRKKLTIITHQAKKMKLKTAMKSLSLEEINHQKLWISALKKQK